MPSLNDSFNVLDYNFHTKINTPLRDGRKVAHAILHLIFKK